MAKTFFKQPSEIIDYLIDMTEYFDALDTDEVASVATAVDLTTDPILEIGPGSFPDTVLVGTPPHSFKLWVGGGLDGSKYKVTLVVTTLVGRIEELEFNIKVKET